MPKYTRAEQETILRFDPAERILHLFTADPFVAKRWRKLGYTLLPTSFDGEAEASWQGTAPLGAFRHPKRLVGGVPSKRAPRGAAARTMS